MSFSLKERRQLQINERHKLTVISSEIGLQHHSIFPFIIVIFDKRLQIQNSKKTVFQLPIINSLIKLRENINLNKEAILINLLLNALKHFFNLNINLKIK